MQMTFWSMMGLLGVGLYLIAYAALQFGALRGSSAIYSGLNLAAAVAVLVSLTEAFNLSSALIQISWIALSVIGLIRLAILRRQTQFTEEEQALLAMHFPSLPPQQARQFLRLGTWQRLSADLVLTRQGSPASALTYLASGAAEVRAHGAIVGRLGAGALVGELSVIHGAEATADVEITAEARVFSVASDALRRELLADHDFALAVSRALQIEAQRKLDTLNRAAAGR
ncbi:cyclic nucleotide-binding domain-containing protein [Gymnodinialimonas sp. 2305UL16-5]|uniref:Crp/Fnr family transcriptional regulator n=1 Tax=Gymnodinialimonas mytili TaxID=3126503 RepID=UPI0030A85F28